MQLARYPQPVAFLLSVAKRLGGEHKTARGKLAPTGWHWCLGIL
ncbi:hypothetical protein PPRY_a2625 [Pseudoalteromonas prydzensis ACAM 620]|nr:hypothetical protein [Pseudoalteromonas prydzensis ACAM 620]